jgi:hypothetical protein
MNETPGTALSNEIERFATLVQSLGIYEQVLYFVVCRVRARGKAKTAPLSVVSAEYQQTLKPLGVFRDQMPPFWDTLGLLETAGLVTVRHRSNRILITDMGLPLDEVLAHLSGLDYAAELTRRVSPDPSPRR